jgi:predicted enzyme related to lactoylglutathione lyase
MSNQTKNPFTWVEIYVNDMNRAQKFYEYVLQINMIPMEAPGGYDDLEMLSFPWNEDDENISGALCKTSDMKPGRGGTLVYFASEDCDIEVNRAVTAGGKIVQPKLPLGDHGFCSMALDTEGNTIGFHSNK